jgi:hypothetical protein
MKKIGDVLDIVLFDKDIKTASDNSKLQSTWKAILEKVFYSARITQTSYANNSYYDEISERRQIMTQKAMCHTKIACIENNTLFIEADHQCWIQILQTMQRSIVKIMNRTFPNIAITATVFLLVNDTLEPSETKENIYGKIKLEEHKNLIANLENGERYKNIKNENLKKMFMRLEQRIKSPECQST